MPGLPEGWEWDFDGSRWFYRYKPTGLMQFNFPKPGDEFPEHVGFGAGPIDLAPEDRLASERQVKRRATSDGADNAKSSGSRTNKKPLDDIDELGATGYFDPNDFMYFGPGGDNDFDSNEDEQDVAPSKDKGVVKADSQVSSVAATPSPAPPATVIFSEPITNELDSNSQAAVTMLDGHPQHAELPNEVMASSEVPQTWTPVGFVAELSSSDDVKCPEELAPIELDAWSHMSTFGSTDFNPAGPVELPSHTERRPIEQKQPEPRPHFAPPTEAVEAYPITSASFAYPPLRSDTASAPAQTSEQTRPENSKPAENKQTTFQSWKPVNKLIGHEDVSKRSSMILSGISVLQSQDSELGAVGPKRHSLAGPMPSPGALSRHPSILTPPQAPKNPTGTDSAPAKQPPPSPIPAVLQPAQGLSTTSLPQDPRQHQSKTTHANIPGSNARHESISSTQTHLHGGGAKTEPSLAQVPSVLKPAHQRINVIHAPNQHGQQAQSFQSYRLSNPSQLPTVQPYRPLQADQPNQANGVIHTEQEPGHGQTGPIQHAFTPAPGQMPGRHHSGDIRPITHRVNTLPNTLPASYMHLPPRNGPGLLVFQEIPISPQDPLSEPGHFQVSTGKPTQMPPQQRPAVSQSSSDHRPASISAKPNTESNDGISHTQHPEAELSQNQPDLALHHELMSDMDGHPASADATAPHDTPDYFSHNVDPPAYILMDDPLPVTAPLAISKPAKTSSQIQGESPQLSEAVLVVSQVVSTPEQVATSNTMDTASTDKPSQPTVLPDRTDSASSSSQAPPSQRLQGNSSQDQGQTYTASISFGLSNASHPPAPVRVETPTEAQSPQELHSARPNSTHWPSVHQSSLEDIHRPSSGGSSSPNPSNHSFYAHGSSVQENGSQQHPLHQSQQPSEITTKPNISAVGGSGIEVGSVSMAAQQPGVTSEIAGNKPQGQQQDVQHSVSGLGQQLSGASAVTNAQGLETQPSQLIVASKPQALAPAGHTHDQPQITSSSVVSHGQSPQIPPGNPPVPYSNHPYNTAHHKISTTGIPQFTPTVSSHGSNHFQEPGPSTHQDSGNPHSSWPSQAQAGPDYAYHQAPEPPVSRPQSVVGQNQGLPNTAPKPEAPVSAQASNSPTISSHYQSLSAAGSSVVSAPSSYSQPSVSIESSVPSQTPPTYNTTNQSFGQSSIAGAQSLSQNPLSGHVSPVTRPPSVSQSQVSSPTFSVASLHQTPSSTFSQLQGSPRPSHNPIQGNPTVGQHPMPAHHVTPYSNQTTVPAQGGPQIPAPAPVSSYIQQQPTHQVPSSTQQQPAPQVPLQHRPAQPSTQPGMTLGNASHRPQHSILNQSHPMPQVQPIPNQMHHPHAPGQSYMPQVAGSASHASPQWPAYTQQHTGQSAVQQHQPGQVITQQQPSIPQNQPGQSGMSQHQNLQQQQQQPALQPQPAMQQPLVLQQQPALQQQSATQQQPTIQQQSSSHHHPILQQQQHAMQQLPPLQQQPALQQQPVLQQHHQNHAYPHVQIPGQLPGNAVGQLPQSAGAQVGASPYHQSPVTGTPTVTWNGQQYVYAQQPGTPQQYAMQAPQAVQSPVTQQLNIQVNQTQTQTQQQNQGLTSAQATASMVSAGKELKGWAKRMWKNPAVQRTTAMVGGAIATEAMGGDGVAGAILANKIYTTAQTQQPGNPAPAGRPPGPSHTQTTPPQAQGLPVPHPNVQVLQPIGVQTPGRPFAVQNAGVAGVSAYTQQHAMSQRPPQQAHQARPHAGRPQPHRIQHPRPHGQANADQQIWGQNTVLGGDTGTGDGGQPAVYNGQLTLDSSTQVSYFGSQSTTNMEVDVVDSQYGAQPGFTSDATTTVTDLSFTDTTVVDVNIDVDTTGMSEDAVSMCSVDDVNVVSTTDWSSSAAVDYSGGDWGDGW